MQVIKQVLLQYAEKKQVNLSCKKFARSAMQFHMPVAMPNENLYGLVARFAILNGLTNHLQASQRFLHSQHYSVADTMLDGDEDCLYRQYYLADADKSQLTLERLRAHLGEVQEIDSVLVPARKSTLQNESFGDTAFWRYCPECYRHDIAAHGVGYWHLAHQLPTTLICTDHHLNLHEITLKKKYLHDRLWLIDDALKFQKTFDSPLDEHWLHIAEIGDVALDDNEKPHSSAVIRQTIISVLRQHRLVDAREALKVNAFEASFLAFFGEDFISTLNQRLQIKKPRYLVTELLHGFKGRALNRLVLVYWLFGTWQYFKLCCDWHAVFNTGNVTVYSLNQRIIEQQDKVKAQSRELCESYLLSTDKPNRIEFCRMFYSSFRWLLNHDRDWFDRVLPVDGYLHQKKLRFE